MKIVLALALMILTQSCNNNHTDHPLTGSWQIVADQLLDSANNIIRQDTSVSGLLIYLANGKMSVQILWKAARTSIINDTIMKQDGVSAGLGLGFNTWTGGQARKLIDTYDAYFGEYRVDWKTNTVTHTMIGNLRPEKQGTAYKRIFQLKGDSLFLKSTDPALRWQTAFIRNKD